MLSVGTPAPAFSAPDQAGTLHSLADFHGSWLVLYFYPKDDTSGCTTEACSFRDNLSDLKAKGMYILGVSADSVDSHRAFATKNRLTFPLLSDPDKKIIHAYGAWGPKNFMGKEYDGILRMTFLIDPLGTIAKIYPKVMPEEHAKQIMKDLTALTA